MDDKNFVDQLISIKQNSEDFKSWSRFQKLQTDSLNHALTEKRRKCWRDVRIFLVGVFACILYQIDIVDLLTNEECLIPTLEVFQDLFRPPSGDCSYCQIDSIHVRTNLTEEEFFEKYAYSGLPVLVEDGMRDWNTDQFSFDYFKELYSNVSEKSFDECQFFGYRTEFKSLHDVFAMDEDRAQFKEGTKPWYIGWGNCIASVTKELRKHYTVPYFLTQNERTREDWMFMGSPGYRGAPLHIDNVDYNSWQAQIRGTKSWLFTPPPECYYECPPEQRITVKPGNVFVFDSNRWFHSTEVLPGEYSLTIGAEYD